MEHLENKDNPLPEYITETFPVTGTQGQTLWDVRGLVPGVYYYTLKAGESSKSGKIILGK